MKIRKGFVTNSSSSSFIIGKKDDVEITIDSVFEKVKTYYIEMYEKLDKLVAYIQKRPELGLTYTRHSDGENYIFWDFEFNEKIAKKEHYIIDDKLEEKFGISTYDYFVERPEWLDSCSTYKEYEEYWVKKLDATQDKWSAHAPFTIADFNDAKDVRWVHTNGEIEPHIIDSKSDVLGYYFPYIDMAFENKTCKECGNDFWCNKKECASQKEKIKRVVVDEEKACLYLMGKICVYSESGYIPEYVVKKLKRVSEYSSNHMG